MRITTKNYFKAIKDIGFEKLPDILKKSHLVIMTKTDLGNDWGIYNNDADVKRVFDLAFEKLEEFIDKKENLSGIENTETNEKFEELDTKTLYDLHCGILKIEGENSKEIKHKRSIIKKIIDEREDKDSANSSTSKASIRYSTEVKFMKKFLELENQIITKTDLSLFIEALQEAIIKRKVTKRSPFYEEINIIQTQLLKVYNKPNFKSIQFQFLPKTKTKFLTALKKITDITKYDSPKKAKGLDGVEAETEIKPKQNLMSSMDFANLQFNSIGFSGKWLNLIGDPNPGFTAMVFGKPKMGKSYLCVDFAGYLARNHGTVLYVANEEKLDATLQMKLNDKDVKHENLFVSDYLPEDLSKYQFIILDSVNKLGLSPKDLENLKKNNPGKSFIFIFQTTKDGKFKGANSYQHDVDVVIEVPERGKAVQFGRFNQGGEMGIFEDTTNELSGVKKSTNKIEIEAELGIPLEELAIEMLNKKEPKEKIVEVLDNEPYSIYDKLIKMLTANIKSEGTKVEIKEVEFSEIDNPKLAHGAAYFRVKLVGSETELHKVAGEEQLFNYDWEQGIAGVKKSRKNLEVSKKVSNVAAMKKNPTEIPNWTEPKHLDKKDHTVLKEINRLYKAKKYNEAMNVARETDTIVREEIPGDIWKKMGGQLTKTGEEKLRAKTGKFSAESIEQKNNKPKIIFNHVVRILKSVIEREWDLELTDADYIEILDIAEKRSNNFASVVNEIDTNLKEFLTTMWEAMKEWDKNENSKAKSRKKFDPGFYANRKDDDNPSYIFSMTSSKILVEAIHGDFDLIYLVRRELANRGQDSKGKWVGFDEAAKIHRIEK